MPGNPQECRERALRCAQLAMSAKSEELKESLIELSKNWEKLATDLESIQILMREDRAYIEAGKVSSSILPAGPVPDETS